MMANNEHDLSVTYETGKERYIIDACEVQRKAMDTGQVEAHAFSHGHYPGIQIDPKILSGISSIGVFNITKQQDWFIPPHRNEGVEICFQQTGESNLKVNGSEHILHSGWLSITRPWQLHSMGYPTMRPGRLFWLILDVGVRRPDQDWQFPDWFALTPDDEAELVKMLRGNEHPVWQANKEINAVFESLGKLLPIGRIERVASRIRVLVNQLLVEMHDLLKHKKLRLDTSLSSEKRSVELFLNEIQESPEHLAYPWTLDSLAARCGMKRSAFAHYCKEIANLPPMELINRFRINIAAEQLRNELDKDITQIAMEMGFSSSQYFSRRFKHYMEKTPIEWRNEYEAEQS